MLVWEVYHLKSSSDARRRSLAARRLGDVASPKALQPLIDSLEDPSSDVRRESAIALGRIGGPAAVVPLLSIREIGEVAIEARKAARAIGEQNSSPLEGALLHPDNNVRTKAAAVLQLMSWEPSNKTQQAIFAVVTQNWEEVEKLGEAAQLPLQEWLADETTPEIVKTPAAVVFAQLDPVQGMSCLLHLAGNSAVAGDAVEALEKVLEDHIEEMTTDNLQFATSLTAKRDVYREVKTSSYDGPFSGTSQVPEGTEPIDCSRIHQLAQEELERRVEV
ncbi:MAG: HEAT repeat domain-containing protein [Planctomycetota bacterium]|jgi:HEAT repeat protein|nr:HEAT repeat domain-containing protein [Planctomycetota bacterium]